MLIFILSLMVLLGAAAAATVAIDSNLAWKRDNVQ